AQQPPRLPHVGRARHAALADRHLGAGDPRAGEARARLGRGSDQPPEAGDPRGRLSTAPLPEALEGALPARALRVEMCDRRALRSSNGGPTFSLRSPQALGHVLRSPGQLGVGRAYVSGALDVDDVEAALALLDTWKPPAIELADRAKLAAAAVRAGALRS